MERREAVSPVIILLALAILASCREHAPASLPQVVPHAPRFASITAGDGFTCGLTDAGAAWCWGANQYGQLGSRAATSDCKVDMLADGPCSLVPVPVEGNYRFTAIDAGSEHVCALDGEGTAYCWGKNIVGELGVGSTRETCRIEYYARAEGKDYEPEPCIHAPVAVATPLRFTAVSAGNYFTCALARDGRAYCWGSRRNGRVGAGDRTDRHPEVVAVDAPVAFTSISAYGSLACALSSAGDVYCWGGNRGVAATRVVASVRFTEVSRGWGSVCGISTDAHAYCWGENQSGERGTGDKSGAEYDSIPRLVSIAEPVRWIDAGFMSTCAIATSGALYCWGDGSVLGAPAPDGCFHVDATDSCALSPVRVPLDHVATVVGGFMHRCALTADHALYCWGANETGEFGDGTKRSGSAPAAAR